MGKCGSKLQGLSAELSEQLDAIEALLNSKAMQDVTDHAKNVERAFQAVLSMNMNGFKSQYNSTVNKKISKVTAHVIASKADLLQLEPEE